MKLLQPNYLNWVVRQACGFECQIEQSPYYDALVLIAPNGRRCLLSMPLLVSLLSGVTGVCDLIAFIQWNLFGDPNDLLKELL